MKIDNLYGKFLECEGVTTDSRQVERGNLFVALKGPNFNGNEFAEKALAAGARFAVVDEERFADREGFLLVDDGLEALQALARHHRKVFRGYVLALTGSNGKTTTKELIDAVLSRKYRTIATKGNLNNHIGVPLTLLRMEAETEIAIIEMGANHLGEIAELCRIADPDGGLITNIGKAHIGTFGGFENIVRGKSELYDHLSRKGGDIWVNTNDRVLRNMRKRFENPYTYPRQGDFLSVQVTATEPHITYDLEGSGHSELMGEYNFQNIAAALAVGKVFEVDISEMKEAIAGYRSSNNRSEWLEKGKHTILLDAYNANPSSVDAALSYFRQTPHDKEKWVILGDMFELGEEAEAAHREVGRQVLESGLKALFVGQLMQAAHRECPGSLYAETTEKAGETVSSWNPVPRLILIKGSRGMRLERLLDRL